MTSATVTCPAWCQGTQAEHQFELDHGYEVEHFAHINRGKVDRTPAVSVCVTENRDGTLNTYIGVEDDEYDVDMAERTALAMLEAVKVARS